MAFYGKYQPPHHAAAVSVYKPHHTKPLLIDSPHSGRNYPADFVPRCNFAALVDAEDNWVDELARYAPTVGATLIAAEFPRTYIDVNRCVNDIDLQMLDGAAKEKLAPTAILSEKGKAGAGLIRRWLTPGVDLYPHKLSETDISHRINYYYLPYHQALQYHVEQLYSQFGQLWHINIHSMPRPSGSKDWPDMVLGDRDGSSSAGHYTQAMADILRGLGYKVAINYPYKGVEILRRYGRPLANIHSIQLEIGKHLYWDRDAMKKTSGFSTLQENITELLTQMAGWQGVQLPLPAPKYQPLPRLLAAE